MQLNDEKLRGLFSRVYNSKLTQEQDQTDINEYIQKLFNSGMKPSLHELHQFNNLVVQKADEIAKPKATEILSLLADYKNVGAVTAYEYRIPKKSKAKLVWAANGSSADRVRTQAGENRTARPVKLQTGFYYEPLDLVQDSVEGFRNLVNDVADAKIRMYFEQVSILLQAAIATTKIPNANVHSAANITLADYNKVASTLARYGGKPIFIADTLLIDHLAQQQGQGTYAVLLTDDIRKELLTSLNPTTIGRTTAVNLVNPFVDDTNSKTELPVNEGYMIAGDVREKPFKVFEFGGLTQYTTFDPNIEQIEMKLYQDCAVELVFGEAIGFIKDDAIVL